jgi:hypothetical protein
MPRVHHVKKARKDNPVAKKGEPYYWWKFRYGTKHYSKTPPRASQLTQSKWSGVCGAEEDLADTVKNCNRLEDKDGLVNALDDTISEVQGVADEYQESADNIESAFDYSPTAELCQERADQCEQIISDLEAAKGEIEDAESEDDFQAAVEAVSDVAFDEP